MQAEAGYRSLTGEADGPPARFGISIIGMITGTTAAMAMLAALVYDVAPARDSRYVRERGVIADVPRPARRHQDNRLSGAPPGRGPAAPAGARARRAP